MRPEPSLGGVVKLPRSDRRPAEEAAAIARGVSPIDWPTFWSSDSVPEEWVIEPIVPKGRQVAVYSPPKDGKSLFALDSSAAAAAGRSVLGQPARPPRSVVYLDFEMTPDDVRERLDDLGYGPSRTTSATCLLPAPHAAPPRHPARR